MRITFQLSTGLGDTVAEVGETLDILDPIRVQELLVSGKAIIATDEEPPAPVTAITTQALDKPKKGGKP